MTTILLRKMLLVDDEPDGADLAAELLRSHGLVVLVAHSADEALELLKSNDGIDAVLSDVMMPGINGLQFAQMVSQTYPSIKIILMSGYVMPDIFNDGQQRYPFVAKPYRIDTVLKLLRA